MRVPAIAHADDLSRRIVLRASKCFAGRLGGHRRRKLFGRALEGEGHIGHIAAAIEARLARGNFPELPGPIAQRAGAAAR
jgi:hypothetical protein